MTGLLIVCLNEAVKLMPLLEGLEKTYRCVMRLHRDAPKTALETAFKTFTGKIAQTPPVRSSVSRKERQREIFYIKLSRKTGKDVEFEVKCESGTYIRKLVHDIGASLGVGAHMSYLRRVRVGPFSEKESVKLAGLKEMDMIKLEDFLGRLGAKKVAIKNSFIKDVINGRPIKTDWISKMDKSIEPGDKVAVFDSEGNAIALGESLRSYMEYSFDISKRGHSHIYIKTKRILNI